MGFPSRRRRHPEEGIAAECEAFLAGTSARLLDRHERPVPSWAWVNVLAHADHGRMVQLASGVRDDWRTSRTRDAAALLEALAASLLAECSARAVPLRQLQRRRLVPLELRLAESGAFLRPDELTSAVLGSGTDPGPADGYPAPAIGRNMGRGRFNRAMLMILGPASISSRPRQ
jgi:hypothetical protein